MMNENERHAFYHILFPRKDENKGMTARVPDVNETRLNDNFRIVGDEFRKLWQFIKGGFKTKTATVEGDASVGGDLDITGDASVGGALSAIGDITSNGKSVVLKKKDDSTSATYTITSNNYLAIPYPTGLNGNNVIGISLLDFGTVSGPVNIVPYGFNNANWYLIGANGTSITSAKFRYWYI